MRKLRFLLLVSCLVFVMGGGTRVRSGLRPDPLRATVEPKVWDDFLASPDRRGVFVVVMREVPGAGPESAVTAQIALQEPLAALQRVGSVGAFAVHLGANVIVVSGTASAVRFLARWPEVAAIRAWQEGAFDVQPAGGLASAATGAFTGRVTRESDGASLPGIDVKAYLQTGPTTWQLLGKVTTASDGTYTYGGLTTGIYRAQFIDPGAEYVPELYNNQREFYLATNFAVTDTQVTSDINAALARAGKVSGNVTQIEGGDPAVDVSVSAWYWDTASGSWRSAGSVSTDGGGNYLLGGLATGTYRLQFADVYVPPRYLTEYYDNKASLGEANDVPVTAGSTTSGRNAALGQYGRIVGTVFDEDGTTPLPGIYVDGYEYDSTYGTWEWVVWEETDSTGQYSLGGLVTRDYRVGFTDPAGPFVTEYYNDKATLETADNVHVELNAVTSGVDASLAPVLAGDVNRDCQVDVVDIMLVASRWNTALGDTNYDARYDLDDDGNVDIVDIMLVSGQWGRTCAGAAAQ